MSVELLHGDCLEVLPQLQEQSVQCVVTSPPYYGLRDYGVTGQIGIEPVPDCLAWARGEAPCGACYVCTLRAVFALVWRVLRADGTLWLNLGDSYSQNSKWGGTSGGKNYTSALGEIPRARRRSGIPDKNLLGIPWRVALALQADGWVLRSDVIWSKPNAMPESVKDRPTRAHEYVFLLAKQGRYYFDSEAIAEPAVNGDPTAPRGTRGAEPDGVGPNAGRRDKQGESGLRRYVGFNERWEGREPLATRNARTVWTISTRPYAEAHFATFPETLAERCIRAGSRPGDTILDPFGGSGTTGRVAERLNRNAVLIELNPDYISLQERRTDGVQRELLFVPSVPPEIAARLAAFNWTAAPDGDGWVLSGNGDDAYFASLAGLEDWLSHQERAAQKREAA